MSNYPSEIIEKLTKRKIEVSLLILEGETTNAIAKKLGIKSNTVSHNVKMELVFQHSKTMSCNKVVKK